MLLCALCLLLLQQTTSITDLPKQYDIVYPKVATPDPVTGSLLIKFYINGTEAKMKLQPNRHLIYTNKVHGVEEDGSHTLYQMMTPCHYHGKFLNEKYSSAVISTCRGIRGTLLFRGKNYYIAPLDNPSLEAPHIIYKPPRYPDGDAQVLSDNLETQMKSQTKRNKNKRSNTNYKMNNTEILEANVRSLERRFLELSVVVDYYQYNQVFRRNETATMEFVLDVVNHLSAKYLPFNIIVGLVQLKIWTRRNPIYTGNDTKKILKDFEQHRFDVLYPETRSDISILISGYDFEGTVIGLASPGKLCDYQYSANINYDTSKGKDPPYMSTVIAHEVGHVFGVYHDGEDSSSDGRCGCPCDTTDFKSGYKKPEFCGEDSRCIMSATLNANYEYWSGCSKNTFEKKDNKMHTCLYNMPDVLWDNTPVCGNGIVEAGEGCDCGSLEHCAVLDPCCAQGLCQLKNTSSCYTGPCCDNCHIKSKDTTCREQVPRDNECDHEERCDGKEPHCPEDTYRQNGRGCEDSHNNEGYCYDGKCKTRMDQCRDVFGRKAKTGSIGECYQRFNIRGDRFGNCGIKKVTGPGVYTYNKCSEEDMLCGKMHCEMDNLDDATKNSIQHGRNQISSQDKGACLSTEYNRPSESDEDDRTSFFTDMGQVQNGAKCAEGKMCVDHRCIDVTLSYTACPAPNGEECAGNGECNNKNQCFCYKGWDKDSNCQTEVKDWKKMIIFILIALLVVTPVCVGVTVYCLKHQFDLKTMTKDRNLRMSFRRVSTKFNRQSSRTSQKSNASKRAIKQQPTVTHYTRVPNAQESEVPSVSTLANKFTTKVPPPPPTKSLNKSRHKTPLTPPNLRSARLHTRDERASKTYSEGFKNFKPLEDNLVKPESQTVVRSDTNLHKKVLNPPKLLAGRSRESKKAQISGPAGGLCSLKDGRPISILSAQDIKQSSDSIDVSSTRKLFEQPQDSLPHWKRKK